MSDSMKHNVMNAQLSLSDDLMNGKASALRLISRNSGPYHGSASHCGHFSHCGRFSDPVAVAFVYSTMVPRTRRSICSLVP